MPASSSENLVHIEEKLNASLADGSDLDQQVAASSKQILLHKIHFKPAQKPYSLQLDNLKSKYIHLNPSLSISSNSTSNASKTGQEKTMNGSKEGDDGLPSPKVVLYPEEKVRLDWRKIQRVGSGLHNMGNTCFLNSTLQCLTYTAPLVNFCLSEEHSAQCKQQGFCMMCELQRHIRRCYDNNGHAIKPQAILQKLKMIAKHMHWGRQEDAHEFLRYVVDGLQKACLNGYSKLDKFSKETTVVNQIFGGFLRSQVQCLKCKERSNTYDPVLDISLDIKNVQSVERAFEKFVQPETLDSENAYMCPRCKQKVTAQKRLTVHKAPNVLTLQLKRFDINRMFGKISRNIQFHDKLNLRPYMSVRQGEPVMYQLYAVLVHSGSACTMGHYYCYVKSPAQIWYCMNDAMVQQVNASRVFNAEAYLLFYIKMKGGSHTASSKLKTPVIGPQPQKHQHLSHNHFSMNGKQVSGKDIGTPVQRKDSSKLVLPVIGNEDGKKKNNPTSIPPPEKRSKVSFGIRPAAFGKEAAVGAADPDTNSKPRIVMQIKHGKVTTFETSPNGKAKIMESDTKGKSNRLVPYGEDSDSEGDTSSHKGNGHVASSSRKPVNGSKDHSSADKSHGQGSSKMDTITNSSVIFDVKLNTTTSVPGNTHLLDTVPGNTHLLDTARDKLPGNHQKKASDTRHADGSCSSAGNIPLPKVKDNQLKGSPVKATHAHHHHSPSKHSEMAGLTCVTGPPVQKVNATTPWQVQYQDAVASPSLGSTSSSGSANSTTEWQVKDQPSSKSGKAERQCPGWRVTPGPEAKGSNSAQEWPAGKETASGEVTSSQTHKSETCKQQTDRHTGLATSSSSSLSEPSIPADTGDESVRVGKSSHDLVKHTAGAHASSPANSSFVDVSDKQCLLNGFLSSDEGKAIRKKHKKQKKHKKHRHTSDYHRLSDSSDSHEHKSRKKKKKKRKHRHDKERVLNESPNARNKKKSDGKRRSDHEESSEYEWVEKTAATPVMETCPQGQEKGQVTNPKTVPVQLWDDGVCDSYKSNGHGPVSEQKRPKPVWDGTKSSNVVDQLEKLSSSRGYGALVCSWVGDRSHVDQAVDKEREESRKRHWTDEYEEELDAGKTKKVKKHQSDYVVLGYGANPFQKQQDDVNKEKGLWKKNSHGHEGSRGSHHGAQGSHSWYHNGGSTGSFPVSSSSSSHHHHEHSDHYYHSHYHHHHHHRGGTKRHHH